MCSVNLSCTSSSTVTQSLTSSLVSFDLLFQTIDFFTSLMASHRNLHCVQVISTLLFVVEEVGLLGDLVSGLPRK